MSQQTALDVMTEYVPRLRPSMELTHAVSILLGDEESGTPVVENGELVGILSESDCLRVFFDDAYHTGPGAKVSDLMSRDVHTVRSDEPLLKVADRFVRTGFRCFPVVDAARVVVGLVRRRDLLAAMCGAPLVEADEQSMALERSTRQGSMITEAHPAGDVVGPETNKRFQ